MTKRILSLIVSAVVILTFQPSASAQSSPIFGPSKYTREKGRPHEFKENFYLCAISGTYKLIVDNGTYITTEEDDDDEKDKDKDKKDNDKHKKKEKKDKKEKKTRVSAGEIEINGQEIIKEHDFKKRLARVQRTINLPQGENRIEIEVKGKPGAFITVSIECVSGCLEPEITSPTANSIVNKSKTIVQGNLTNLYGEAGVTIWSSGISGQVSVLTQIQGTNFAGIIPLQQGQNSITAIATDACGYKATDTITINTATLEEKIRLIANPDSGISPLDIAFEAEAYLPNLVSNYTWDLNGDGTSEQTGQTLSRLTAQYQNPGLYFPTVIITDTQGNTYSETTIVNVLSREEMDVLLKGKWDNMKNALISGNIDKALNNFVGGKTSKYKQVFESIKGQLPVIFSSQEELNLASVSENQIEYENLVVEDGKAYSYPVIFVRDENGLWKIKQF